MTIFFATAAADTASLAGIAGDQVSFINSPIRNVVSLNPFVVQAGWAAGDQYGLAISIFTLSNFGDFFSGDGRSLTVFGGAMHDAIAMNLLIGNIGVAYGGGDDDTFISSAGFETFYGDGEGRAGDAVAFNDSPIGVIASLADQSINTGQAKGDIYFSIEDLQGSRFADTLYSVADGRTHQLIGDPGIADGIGGNDTLYGATGPNSGYTNFIGGAGADTFHLGDGGNLIDYETAAVGLTFSLTDASLNTGDAAGDVLIGQAGRNIDIAGTPFVDTLYGDEGNNNIIADPYDDGLYGATGGNDRVFGMGGNDILTGNLGADTLDGGTGYNYASYSLSRFSGVTADLETPSNGTGEAAGDVYINIQGLFGSAFGDTLRGDGGNNILVGLAGNDQLFGGSGDDILNGGAGGDAFDGGSGYDAVLYNDATIGLTIDLANPGNSTGEAAGDTYVLATIEALTGTKFNDSITGGASALVIDGGLGDDTIRGGAGNDGIFGGAGADMLFGGGGADNFAYRVAAESSGASIDTIADFVAGQDSVDISLMALTAVVLTRTLTGGTILTANAGGTAFQINFLTNIAGTDLAGLAAGITVNGSNNGEALNGSVFGDTITGGLGADTITTADGVDIIRYTAASQSTPGASDLITDFATGIDKLDFSTLAPTDVTLVNNAGTIEVNATTAGGAIRVRSSLALLATDILGVTAGILAIGANTTETLRGTQFNDTLQGNGGGDALFGGLGADTFVYALTSDSVAGSNDILFDFATGEDRIDLSLIGLSNAVAQQITLQYNGDASTTLFATTNSGNFTLTTSSFLATADIIGLTRGAFLIGTAAGEALVGTASADVIDGNGGADTLTGGAGADVFRYFAASDSTPAARDQVTDFQTGLDSFDLGALGASAVTLTRGASTTVITATTAGGNLAIDVTGLVNGNDMVGVTSGLTLIGNATSESLTGTGFNDTIIGGDGQDSLTGGGGADVFRFTARSQTPQSAPDSITDFQSGFDKIDLTGFGATGVSLLAVGGVTQISGTTPQGAFQINATGTVLQTDILGLTAGILVTGNNTSETLNGTPFNDTLQGNGGGDALFGGLGADIFRYALTSDSAGGAVDIIFDFATGSDTIDLSLIGLSIGVAQQVTLQHAGDGGTTLFATTDGGAFTLGLTSFLAVTDIIGLTRGAFVIGAATGENLEGSAFADIIDGNGGADTLTGGAGADVFRYFAAADSTPGARDQVTDFQSGVDSFDFGALGATAVTLTRGGSSTAITATTAGGAFAIDVSGLVNASDIVGVSGLTLIGNGSGEALTGTGGNDTITGGDGQDTLTGGGGSDVFRFTARSHTPQATPDSITDFQSGFDQIDLTGLGATGVALLRTGGVTQLSGTTPQGAFQINVAGVLLATDILGLTSGVTVTGDNTSETQRGTAFADTLQGNGGGDALFGGLGADLFRYALTSDSAGGAVDIIFDFATGSDRVDLSLIGLSDGVAQQVTLQYAGDGGTTLFGTTGGGSFTLGLTSFLAVTDIIGLTRGAFLIGAGLGQSMIGSAFADIIDGNGGADTLTGGAGADVFRYFAAADSTPGARDQVTDFQTGLDSFDFGALGATAMTLTRGASTTAITATTGGGAFAIDVSGLVNGSDLIGVSSGLTLIGNSTGEALSGTGFNDTITGGDGQDSLTGGGGSDVFRFTARNHTPSATPDSITDFQSGFDQIDLTGLGAGSVVLLKTGSGTQISGETAQGAFQINVTGTVLATDILGLTSGVTVRGDNTAETLQGTPFADTLQGAGGADALFGGAGADTFRFVATTDSVSGNSDILLDFATGTDRIDLGLIGLTPGSAQQVTLQYAGDGGTALFATTGSGTFVLGSTSFVATTDLLGLTAGVFAIGAGSAQNLTGSAFADIIDGNGGADTITGGNGADVIRYFAPSDSSNATPDVILDFQAGIDRFDIGALNPSAVTIARLNGGTTISVAGAGGTTVFNTNTAVNGNDFISFFGTATITGDGSFQGSAFADRMVGDGAANSFTGATGNDTIDGGGGTDTANFSGTQAQSRIGVRDGTVIVSGADGLDTLTQVEQLKFGAAEAVSIGSLGVVDELALVLTGGVANYILPDIYSGPVPTLQYQVLGTNAGDVGVGTSRNDFFNLFGGDDALDAGAGNDVLDGGTGSNFLTGGAGIDTFFLDGRGGTTTWSTITDWQAGEQLSVFGWRPGVSTVLWVASAGAVGYEGVTMFGDLDGNGSFDTSVTWTGRTMADLPVPFQFADPALLWFVG